MVRFAPTLEQATPEYVGYTLSTTPYTYHVPSDNAMLDSGNGIIVKVWNPTELRINTHCYELGRTDWKFEATIDAPPMIMEAAEQWQRWHDKITAEQQATERAAFEAKQPAIGKQATVKPGRKHAGKTGIIFWMQSYRLGIRTSDRKNGKSWQDVIWTNAEAVDCAPAP